MNVRATLGVVRRHALCAAYRRLQAVGNGNREPLVSFCFDDFPRTAYTVGGSILQTFGVKGTYYVSAGLMNKSNELGDHFREDDLHSLAEDGHELATHTCSHVSSRKLPVSVFRQEVRKGREALLAMGLPASANFAYPYGEVTLAAKKAVGQDMASCRGTYGGVNGPFVDLNLLRANWLYGDLEKLALVETLLSRNQAQNGWVIFYTHDVRPNPSRYGCTPSLLEEAVSHAARSGAHILTVAEVLAGLDPASRDSHAGNPDALLSALH